jgi:four helix bundle suffix protein
MLLTFCQMETFLLKRQIDSLKNKFVIEGGFRENLFKKRLEYRNKNKTMMTLLLLLPHIFHVPDKFWFLGAIWKVFFANYLLKNKSWERSDCLMMLLSVPFGISRL